MKSNSLTIVFIMAAFVAAIYAIFDVVMGSSGPLAVAAKWLGISIVLVSFVRPKIGIFALGIFCFYGDYYKKLAVCYGTVSMDTVIEVLAINMAILGAVIAGTVNQMFLTGNRPHKAIVAVGGISMFVTCMLMLTDGPLTGRVQLAVNGGLYISLAGVIAYQYKREGSSLNISRFHYLLGLPWVGVACYQYVYGFSDMDYFYARTGLSSVFSQHFFMENPRVFGLAGSASAYGAISLLCTYGLWRMTQSGENRALYFIGSIIYLIGLVISEQRTTLLLPFIVLGVWQMFKSTGGTRLFYSVTLSVAFLGVSFSGFLLENINSAESTLNSMTGGSGWAGNVLRVGTFSDRLKGWTRLTKPESYSLFGTKLSNPDTDILYTDDEYAHDMINSILQNYGVIGLLACGALLFFTLRAAHRMVLEAQTSVARSTSAFTLANLSVALFFTLLGGSNLHTVPLNLIIATFLGHALALTVNKHQEERENVVVKVPSQQTRTQRHVELTQHGNAAKFSRTGT